MLDLSVDVLPNYFYAGCIERFRALKETGWMNSGCYFSFIHSDFLLM